MFENSFGYDERVPEKIRTILMWLCKDMSSLQSKWDFYLELYGSAKNTDLLSELAPWSFNIIEETLRNDMTMAICRLSDPAKSLGKDNLSLAYLVENCREFFDLTDLLKDFQVACEPISKYRNKQIGHNDLNTVIRPRENPLPDVSKEQINKILQLAADILNRIFIHFTGGELSFHIISRDGADTLIFWLNAGKELHMNS